MSTIASFGFWSFVGIVSGIYTLFALGVQVQFGFASIPTSMTQVKTGKLRAIAQGGPKRSPVLPDLPAIAETLPGFVSATWVGAFLPPKTPKQIADKLTADFTEAVREPQVARRFRDHASEPAGLAPEAIAAFVRNEAERWKKVIHTAGIKLD